MIRVFENPVRETGPPVAHVHVQLQVEAKAKGCEAQPVSSSAASDDCLPVPFKHGELFLNMDMIYDNGECVHE
jgi:hypothetical protein